MLEIPGRVITVIHATLSLNSSNGLQKTQNNAATLRQRLSPLKWHLLILRMVGKIPCTSRPHQHRRVPRFQLHLSPGTE